MCRIRSFDSAARSVPSNQTWPAVTRATGCGSSPMTASAVMLLPQPDSPTRPKHLALAERKAHLLDRLEGAPRRADADLQVLDHQKRLWRGGHHFARSSLKRGSRRSRRTSPTRLSENTVRMIAAPGNMRSQGARVM